jgi:hypothetical protein
VRTPQLQTQAQLEDKAPYQFTKKHQEKKKQNLRQVLRKKDHLLMKNSIDHTSSENS